VAGDSAGGGLTLALAFALRDAGRPLPAALGLICPWTDLRPDLAQRRPPAPREPLLNPHRAGRWARDYLSGGARPDDPLLSPVLGELRGLPPIVMHSCEDDLIVEDSWALARRAEAQGVAIEHHHLEGVWHVVHLSAWVIGGLGDPVGTLGRSLRAHLP
jgi:acetyl esterase/lipase